MNGYFSRLQQSIIRLWDRGRQSGTSSTELKSTMERNQSPNMARLPPWSLYAVPAMLIDEYIEHGLTMIDGPIQSNTRVAIVAEGDESKTSRVERSKKAAPPGQQPPGNPAEKPPIPPKPKAGEALAVPPSLQKGEEAPAEEELPPLDEDDPFASLDSLDALEPSGLPDEVESYIAANLNVFLDACLDVALLSVRYGYAPAEPVYEEYDGIWYLKALESIDPFSCEPYTDNLGRFDGIKVTKSGGNILRLRDFMGIPKGFWTVHRRHIDRWYGQSRLRAAYPTFFKKWSKKGLGELLRIWMTKDAYDSGVLYYDTQGGLQQNGQKVTSNRGLAIDIMNQRQTGNVTVLPGDTDPQTQKRRWELQPPGSHNPPTVLFQAIQDCDARMLLAMGVSPELVQNFQTGGMGSASGRAIPETAFYSMLAAIIKPIILDFKEQIMDKLLLKRFGRRFHYRLVVLPLAGDDQSSSSDPKPFSSNDVPGGEGEGGPTPPPSKEQQASAERFVAAKFGSAA